MVKGFKDACRGVIKNIKIKKDVGIDLRTEDVAIEGKSSRS
jgi:hypothetical protein